MPRPTLRAASALAALIVLPAALAACATPEMAGPAPSMGEAAARAPAYVAMAGSSDLYEITSSQLVLEAAQNPDVRRFAQMMTADHGMTTQQVMDAARAAGLSPPPPALAPQHARMLDDLRAVQGAARERMYVDQQVMAHEQALALHQGFASGGDAPPLRTVAAAAAPIVRRHLDEIRAIRGRM